MKRITTIPVITLLLLTLACNAQELKTHNYYDVIEVNSIINSKNIQIAVKEYYVDSFANECNLLHLKIDSIKLAHFEEIQLLKLAQQIGDVEYTALDTLTGAVTTLKIEGENKWYTIVNGEYRYHTNIVNDIMEIVIGQGNTATLLVRYDLENNILTKFNYK